MLWLRAALTLDPEPPTYSLLSSHAALCCLLSSLGCCCVQPLHAWTPAQNARPRSLHCYAPNSLPEVPLTLQK